MEKTLEGAAERIQEKLLPRLDSIRKRAGEVNARVVGYIREHPGACLLGALGAGFIIAWIARRMS